MQHFKIKAGKPLIEQAELGHNRWHSDLPFLATVQPGEEIIIETLDFLDAQIHNDDDPSDVRDIDLTRAHPLTGPFEIAGAEPGDLLVVDLLDITPVTAVGFSGIFAKNNGGGFLAEYFPDADKAIWDLKGLYTTSRHVPGVRFAGLTHGSRGATELLAQTRMVADQCVLDPRADLGIGEVHFPEFEISSTALPGGGAPSSSRARTDV